MWRCRNGSITSGLRMQTCRNKKILEFSRLCIGKMTKIFVRKWKTKFKSRKGWVGTFFLHFLSRFFSFFIGSFCINIYIYFLV